MKRLIFMIVPVLICGLMFTSCGKDSLTDSNEIEGTYVGSYITTNLTRGLSWDFTTTIVLKEGKFTYKETPEGIYRNVYGNYSINKKKIIFKVENYDFPWLDILYIEGATTLLLEGEYNYTFDGEKMTFSKIVFALSPEEKFSCEFELYKK